MKWRRISQSEIVQVVTAPDKIEKSYHDCWNAFKKLSKRNIRVTYKEEKRYLFIIRAVDKND